MQGLLERMPYSLGVVLDGLIWRTGPLVLQLALSLAVIGQMMGAGYVVGFLALAVGFVGVSWLGFQRQIRVARVHNENLAQSSQRLGDVLKNARRVVSNGAIPHEVKGVEETFDLRERSEAGVNGSLSQLSGMQWLVMALALGAVMAMGGRDVLLGRITTGDFVLLQAYAIRLSLPLSTVAFVLSQSASALATLSEVLGLQGSVPAPILPPRQPKPATVTVDGVSFSYGPGRAQLQDISVDFPAGSISVIVGANGSGKSTLAQLIAGQLVPDHGRIFAYTGRSATDCPTAAAGSVLYIPQRTSLFNRTLRSNLLYPPTQLRDTDALVHLQAWGFQSDGRAIDLDLPVGEGGSALSGGQVQKVELARLLGMRASCLILDEATSALDPVSEGRVMADLVATHGSRTTLIFVSHRVEMAERADQVVWMDGGRVMAVGSHSDLIQRREYRQLWNLQHY
ncbi:MAG: hypothetical protein B7Z12_07905 [Caulobacter vibrioides]|uniref:ABC transporter ATP-binding protein n=1 Tax=Caulobacter vibrioides TaxID=155892 RepID=A0A258D7Z3_CAUVI|nr:MAG: hypothetical protein B7Z12_07905 [Caulobacter vibrioides]